MFGKYLQAVRGQRPLIHNITNYVTARDCANLLLACGASPIMADDPQEAAEVTGICNGLTINMGTFSDSRRAAMEAAGRQANALGRPVVLDPVGAGASGFRLKGLERLLQEVQFCAIRGNFSEMQVLAALFGIKPVSRDGQETKSRGVDVNPLAVRQSADSLEERIEMLGQLAAKSGAVIAATGPVDLVSDGKTAFCIYNGDPMMSKITGAGCQLSSLMAAFLAAASMEAASENRQQEAAVSSARRNLEAAAAAVCAWGLCGEKARKRMGKADGSGAYGMYLMDAVFHLTGEELEQGERYELR